MFIRYQDTTITSSTTQLEIHMTTTKLTPDVLGNHGGARLLIDGRKTSVSSVRRYTEYNNLVYGEERDADAKVARAKELGHPLVWVNLESAVITSDRGHHDREAAKWADAPSIKSGDLIDFDGEVFRVEPTFNRNFKLIPA
jgi:hypothetical protein